MVDYKLIADNDVGGDLEGAFNAMSLEIISTTPEVMVTYRRISASVSLTVSAELQAAVLNATLIPAWVNQALAYDGININDPQVKSVLSTLVYEDSANRIIEMGVVKAPKYSNFKIGHLANARQKRAEGKI